MGPYKSADPNDQEPRERDSDDITADHPFTVTCAGCGFMLVVPSFAEASALGWKVILPEQHRGLCPNCARNR
jgi:hypothetical protein